MLDTIHIQLAVNLWQTQLRPQHWYQQCGSACDGVYALQHVTHTVAYSLWGSSWLNRAITRSGRGCALSTPCPSMATTSLHKAWIAWIITWGQETECLVAVNMQKILPVSWFSSLPDHISPNTLSTLGFSCVYRGIIFISISNDVYTHSCKGICGTNTWCEYSFSVFVPPGLITSYYVLLLQQW